MIFPKDTTLYHNLNTSFINFPELLSDLQKQQLTGYVQVRFNQYEGDVFMSGGVIINAVEQPGTALTTGDAALQGITSRVGERNGEISVYTLSPEVTATLAAVVDSEVLYKDLSTSFTSLDRLIDKLGSERHTGYIEIDTSEGMAFGFIFFRAGEAIEGVLCAEGQYLTGADVAPRLVQTASAMDATFHVFRAIAKQAAPPSPPVSAAAESPAVAWTEPDALPTAPATTESLRPAEPEPVAEPEQAEEQLVAKDTPRLIEMWQDIVARVELVIDQMGGKGAFSAALKRSLVDGAGRFPFLDPFAAEFAYRDGVIFIVGQPDKDLSTGLGVCLSATIEKLGLQLRRPDIETLIRASLVETVARYTAAIDRYELRSTLGEFLS